MSDEEYWKRRALEAESRARFWGWWLIVWGVGDLVIWVVTKR